MNNVLEFPSKTFVQWGAIAQEIVSCLGQRGASREEILDVIDRVRSRWEQLDAAAPGHGNGDGSLDERKAAELPGALDEHDMYVSRHWRSQPARILIASAAADFRRHRR